MNSSRVLKMGYMVILMFGFKFMLGKGESVEEFAVTCGTGLDETQLLVLLTVLDAVNQIIQRVGYLSCFS